MTKREICERLMEIRDYAKIADTWQAENATLRDMLAQIDADLRHLLLDLAAPEEEDRDPYNTGMHDEYELDEDGHVKAIHTCENAPKEKEPERKEGEK